MKRKSRFKDEYYVRVYQLARTGIPGKSIAIALQISFASYISWKKKFPALKKAEQLGKNAFQENKKGQGPIEKFYDVVYQHLAPELKTLWNKINAIERTPHGVLRIETLLKDNGKRAHQQLFVYALTVFNFNYNRACSSTHVSKRRLDLWIETDHGFSELLDTIQWHQKNYYEGALLDLVESGDTAAIMMVNKSINADRGYNPSLNVNVNGKVQHEHVHIHVDDLDLPLETRKQILLAVRKKSNVVESNGHKVTSVQ